MNDLIILLITTCLGFCSSRDQLSFSWTQVKTWSRKTFVWMPCNLMNESLKTRRVQFNPSSPTPTSICTSLMLCLHLSHLPQPVMGLSGAPFCEPQEKLVYRLWKQTEELQVNVYLFHRKQTVFLVTLMSGADRRINSLTSIHLLEIFMRMFMSHRHNESSLICPVCLEAVGSLTL